MLTTPIWLFGACFLATSSAQTPTLVGCFSSVQPLNNQGSYKYQSSGYCNVLCQGRNQDVLGLAQGTLCYCGDQLPPSSSKVSLSKCNTVCQGYDLEDCGGFSGGLQYYTVWLTGLKADVPTFQGSASSSGSGSGSSTAAGGNTRTSASAKTSQTGKGSAASSGTGTSTSKATSSSSAQAAAAAGAHNGHKKQQHGDMILAIVLGVVLGVVALAIMGILFFWLWRRNKKYGHPAHRSTPLITSKRSSLQHEESKVESASDKAPENGVLLAPAPRYTSVAPPTPPTPSTPANARSAPYLTLQEATPTPSMAAMVAPVAAVVPASNLDSSPSNSPPFWRNSSVPPRKPVPSTSRSASEEPPLIDQRPGAGSSMGSSMFGAVPLAGTGMPSNDSSRSISRDPPMIDQRPGAGPTSFGAVPATGSGLTGTGYDQSRAVETTPVNQQSGAGSSLLASLPVAAGGLIGSLFNQPKARESPSTDQSPAAGSGLMDTLTVPGGGLTRSDSTQSRASSQTDPFYTPLEERSVTHFDQSELDELKILTSRKNSSVYSRADVDEPVTDQTALPMQRQSDDISLPIQGRDPPGRSGGAVVPTSSEVRDFNFSDRSRPQSSGGLLQGMNELP